VENSTSPADVFPRAAFEPKNRPPGNSSLLVDTQSVDRQKGRSREGQSHQVLRSVGSQLHVYVCTHCLISTKSGADVCEIIPLLPSEVSRSAGGQICTPGCWGG
jgi:hypothetical protein